MPLCPNCGAQQPEGAAFCDECGAALRSPQVAAVSLPGMAQSHTVVAASVCPACGSRTSPQDPFCTNCGASLRGDGPGASAVSNMPADAGVAAPPAAGSGPGATVVAAMSPVAPSSPATPADWASGTITCGKCGALLEPDSAFCDMCGAPVVAPAPSALSPVLPAGATEVSTPSAEADWVWEPAGSDRGAPASEQPEPEAEAPAQPPYVPFAQTPPASPQAMPTHIEAAPTPPAYPTPVWTPDSVPPVPPSSVSRVPPIEMRAKLVLHGTGAALPLPPGKVEISVGREDPIGGIFPDIDLTDYGGDEGGVSRKHARITLQGGQFYIEDLNSVNHTFVNKARLATGDVCLLNDGDELGFGRVKAVFRLS